MTTKPEFESLSGAEPVSGPESELVSERAAEAVSRRDAVKTALVTGGALAAPALITSSVFSPVEAQSSVRPRPVGDVAGFTYLKSYPEAPEVAFQDASGRDRFTREWKGRPILLTFWSVTCHGCDIEMPELNQLNARVSERDLVILPVSIDKRDPLNRINTYYRRRGLSGLPVYTDAHRLLFAFYNGFATPMTFIIDKRGHVVGGKAGVANWNGADAWRFLKPFMEA